MADYSSLKVPELKKLLTERGLPHTGNKADLIARLTDNDNQKTDANAAPAGKLPRSTRSADHRLVHNVLSLSPRAAIASRAVAHSS